MKKYAIIALLSFCCIFVYGQSPISFSKTFETKRKNVPVAIINNHSNYFHVLRYNKVIHDFTIERRNKPNANVLAFTPLKLDSVNANWFNYEKLDYLFYEEDHKIFFIFEKVLNTKRTVYLKIIDSLGKSTGFIELSSLEAEPGVGLKFSFTKGQNHTLLLVGEMSYQNGLTKKSAVLFDTKILKPVWIKKLPYENSTSEITEGFATNKSNDLFYIHYKIKSLALFKRGPVEERIINEFGPISIIKSFSGSKAISQKILALERIEAVYSATLIPEKNDIIFCGHVIEEDFGKKTYLHVERLNDSINSVVYKHKHNLPAGVSEQLTFYDGNDYKDPAYKNYRLKNVFVSESDVFLISERREENYYKELLSWKINLATGELINMNVIPRKIFYFDDRTRFKKLGECMSTFKNGILRSYVLEHPKNASVMSENFKFHSFKKQTNLWEGKMMCYSLAEGKAYSKNLLYSNGNYDFVPMFYFTEWLSDEVFYFNEGKYEKFGFISLPNQ